MYVPNTMTSDLDIAPRFRALWQRTIGCDRSDKVYAALDAGYGSPTRAYHTWSHIAALLSELDQVRGVPEFTGVAFDEVELAIFFHEAVYDPAQHDNEAKSAALLLDLASGKAWDESALKRVAALTEATIDHAVSSDPATQLMVDLDLSILGAPPHIYASYVAGNRQEYAHVPDALWAHGRRAVLARFLNRERILQTAYFRMRIETAARANLQSECDQLSSA